MISVGDGVVGTWHGCFLGVLALWLALGALVSGPSMYMLMPHCFAALICTFLLPAQFGMIMAILPMGRSRPTNLLFSFFCILCLVSLAGYGMLSLQDGANQLLTLRRECFIAFE